MLHFGVGDYEAAAAIPDLDIFGCDPYWHLFGTEPEPFVRAYGGAAAEAARRHGRLLQLWVQAFSVPEGREEELRTGLRVAEELGASHVAAWSFAATATMSQIRCARPDVVWRIIGEEFRRLGRRGPIAKTRRASASRVLKAAWRPTREEVAGRLRRRRLLAAQPRLMPRPMMTGLVCSSVKRR
jgi:hypothetical protein